MMIFIAVIYTEGTLLVTQGIHVIAEPMNTTPKLKRFIKSSVVGYASEESDYNGVLLLWKSIGGTVKRYYVKLVAGNKKIADQLLTQLIWDTTQDLHVKVSKQSALLELYKRKGFQFVGGRGKQLLLCRKGVNNVNHTHKR